MEYILKVFLIIGMVGIAGCCQNFKFERYVSKTPGLDITLDYISGWKVYEQQGSFDTFKQIVFSEPIRKDKALRASMVLTAEKGSKAAFNPKTIEAAYADLVNKRKSFKDMKVLSESRIKVLGAEALECRLSYGALDSPESLNAKLVPTDERVVVFKREDTFYFLRYENFSSEFDRYNKAFDHIIKTLKIKK
ncbi:MAG TPA: hypothetical protein VMD52_01420 [Patescibacteria group bacterium]|nr:hypothetical protein [Patescibacteria group bacterium]